MNTKPLLLILIITLTLTLLASCGGGGGDSAGPSPDPDPDVNVAPVADAGTDQTVVVSTLATLDGSNSFDSDIDPISYSWVLIFKPAGSSAALSATSSVNPSLAPDIEGEYLIDLTVNDGTVSSSADQVSITASSANIAPVANAGPDQAITTSQTIELNGSGSFDNNSDVLSYSWNLTSRPSGSTATLNDSSTVSPSFVADLVGDYTVTLVVNDGQLDSAADSISVEYSEDNIAPVANAGSDRSVSVALVQLDGTASSDANGDLLTYLWALVSRPTGSSAQLAGITSSQPSFTADVEGGYVWGLAVSDGEFDSVDSVVITYEPPNQAPVADAGAAQSVTVGTLVTLDGSSSFDGDQDSIVYSWALTSRPAGSNAALNSSSTVNPSLTVDVVGQYDVSLFVSDGTVSSSADQVSINAVAGNIVPVADAGAGQSVTVGTLVTLDGSNSFDSDQDPIVYSWTLTSRPAGSNAALNSTSAANPSLTVDVVGQYILSLIVNDGTSDSSADQVSINTVASNIAPVANAGANQSITTSQTVQLNGSSSFDNNGDTLTYAWSLTARPSGSTATLSASSTVSPSFVADLIGNYTVTLVVNDGLLDSAADSMSVQYSEANIPPVANAGADRSVSTALVQLDGTASSDANGDSLTYLWTLVSRPSGSGASLAGPTTSTPSFNADIPGTYVWSLVVNDGELASNTDTVTITYQPVNQPPVADAGDDQSVTVANEVTLNGSGSTDNDSDPLSYNWVLATKPAGSNSVLTASTTISPRFTPDEVGSYTINLTVNDGMDDSPVDTVTVQAASNGGGGSRVESFNDSGALTGFVTNNPNSLPDVSQTGGRYRADLTNNANDITTHFNDAQGRLDAWQTRFPFEFIARNIGIGTQADSQQVHPYSDFAYNFAGIQVHAIDLNERNSSHLVVGHRGTDATFTLEGKNTNNGSSQQNDNGSNTAPNTRADLRVVGGSNGSLTFYWQLPNPAPGMQSDNWQLYNGTGQMPGTTPSYGSTVYVGLITYAFGSNGIPFVGTCDSVELIEN